MHSYVPVGSSLTKVSPVLEGDHCHWGLTLGLA